MTHLGEEGGVGEAVEDLVEVGVLLKVGGIAGVALYDACGAFDVL